MKNVSNIKHLLFIFSSLLFAGCIAGFVYLLLLQTPYVGKRELILAGLLWIIFIPILYISLDKFFIPRFQMLNTRSKFGWMLVSAGMGFLAVFAISFPRNFYLLLPIHSLRVEVSPDSSEQSVSLEWISTKLGDVSFSQLQQEGGWEQTDFGLTHAGSSPASLSWRGRTGSAATLAISGNISPQNLRVFWDDTPVRVDGTLGENSTIKVSRTFPSTAFPRSFALLLCWISLSFLFFLLTLFLLTTSCKIDHGWEKKFGKLEKYLQAHLKRPVVPSGQSFWTKRDWLIILFFLALTLLFFLGRWNGLTPFVGLTNDSAYITSYAASLDHPEAFSNDNMFNDPKNFGYYVSLEVPLIQSLENVVGDYGTAFLLLLLPDTFLLLAGFYVFGKLLFGNRLFSALLAICTSLLISVMASDFWGLYIDPWTRMMFQALLPWVLSLVLLSMKRRSLRWLVFVLLGLMIYFHPLSTPAIVFAIWLGYLLYKPAEASWRRHILNQAGLLAIFLVCTIPFFTAYFGSRDISSSAKVDYAQAIKFLTEIFPYTFYPLTPFKAFLQAVFSTGLIIAAFIGAMILYRIGTERWKLGLVLSWMLGILIVCVGLPLIELPIEAHLKILPLFLSIPRSLRYIVPLLEVLIFWSLAVLWDQAAIDRPLWVTRRLFFSTLGILLLVWFNFSFYWTFPKGIADYRFHTLTCVMEGKITCPDSIQLDGIALTRYISSETPAGSRFVSIPPLDIGGLIRAESLRPLAFDPSDRTRMVLGNVSGALKLQPFYDEWYRILNQPEEKQLKLYIDFADQIGADFAVIQSPAPTWLSGRVVYSNASYSLVDLRNMIP